jgi:3-dehydroquinate dehydratase-2
MRILVINGPNLNLLGTREPHIYGGTTLREIEERVAMRAHDLKAAVACFQSNSEGEIVDFIQGEAAKADGIIINAGALTHYSLALRDILQATNLPVIEVHISNIYAREEFRRQSVIAGIAIGQITGLGWRGYLAALDALVGILTEK